MSQDSRKIANTADTLDPDLLIREALERGMLEEAGEAIEALLAADSEHHEGWFLKGVHGLLSGNYAGASAWFEKSRERGADSRAARLGHAQALLGALRAEPAWSILRDLAQDEPGDAEVLHWLLRAGTALEQWDALAVTLHGYLTKHPSDDAARFAYAGVSLRRGQVAEAQLQHDILRASQSEVIGLEDLTRLLEPETLAASAA